MNQTDQLRRASDISFEAKIKRQKSVYLKALVKVKTNRPFYQIRND